MPSADASPPLGMPQFERWTLFGATVRVLTTGDGRATVELCTCAGEAVERRTTTDPEALAWLKRELERDGSGVTADWSAP